MPKTAPTTTADHEPEVIGPDTVAKPPPKVEERTLDPLVRELVDNGQLSVDDALRFLGLPVDGTHRTSLLRLTASDPRFDLPFAGDYLAITNAAADAFRAGLAPKRPTTWTRADQTPAAGTPPAEIALDEREPAAEQAPAAGSVGLVELPVDAIDPHPQNPRRIDDNHPSLPGLAASIVGTGLINPVTVVRNGDRYQLIAGERRWRASRLGGAATILARVMDLTEEQQFHVLTVENLQRDDLTWQEEARGVAMMLERGMDAAGIATAIGRSLPWVNVRMRLCQLTPAFQKWLAEWEEEGARFPLNRLEVIATFDSATQDQLAKRAPWWIDKGSYKEFAEHVDAELRHRLQAAPWDLADEFLVAKAGACSKCPKRTSCQTSLFEGGDTDDRCLDLACWAKKAAAHAERLIEDARHRHPHAKLVLDGHAEPPHAYRKIQERLWNYTEVSRKGKDTIEAILVSGDRAGAVVHLKNAETQTRAAKPEAGEQPKAKPAKERVEEHLARRRRECIRRVIKGLGGNPDAGSYEVRTTVALDEPLMGGWKRPKGQALLALVLAVGVDVDPAEWTSAACATTYVDHSAGLMKIDQVYDVLWSRVQARLIARLHGQVDSADDNFAELVTDCCGMDYDRAIRLPVQDAMPLPKTLAAEFEENGTKRRGVTAAKDEDEPKPKRRGKDAAAGDD